MRVKDSIRPYIIHTMFLPFTEKEALQYLKDRGFDISVPYYYRLKKGISESRDERLTLIANHGFIDQHLQRIDQLELINQELWKEYRSIEKIDAVKAALILMQIADLQSFISPYYEASKWIMEESIKQNDKQQESKKSLSDT